VYIAGVGLDDSLHEVVFGLEVVIHVPDRDVGDLSDVGERRPLNALLVQNETRRLDEPVALARPLCL